MRRAIPAWTALLLAACAGGCTTVREPFPGQDPARVWRALVAVAVTPDYTEPAPEPGTGPPAPWHVKENMVWVDETTARIEIYREIARVERLTSTRPYVDRRDWRLQVRYEGGDPPTVVFRSRGTGVPRHAQKESDRYFADVRQLLGPAESGAPVPGGAATPEGAVRDLLRGMLMLDEASIRRVIVPTEGAETLWSGSTAEALPFEVQAGLRQRIIRPARAGELVEIDGELTEVDPALVQGDRRLILATVASEDLAPFFVVRAGDRWRVDPAAIIARRRALEGR